MGFKIFPGIFLCINRTIESYFSDISQNLYSIIHFLFSLITVGQKKLLKEFERFSAKLIHPDTVLARLQSENDLVIGFDTYNPDWGIPPHYLLVAKNGKEWRAYEYIFKEIVRVFVDSSGKQYQEPWVMVNTFEIDSDLIDSLFAVFKTQKVWELNCNTLKDFFYCSHLKNNKYDPCGISDASSVGLLVMTKQYISSSSFYAPEYYEYECCPGNSDRQRFLATIAPIKQLFKRLLQKE